MELSKVLLTSLGVGVGLGLGCASGITLGARYLGNYFEEKIYESEIVSVLKSHHLIQSDIKDCEKLIDELPNSTKRKYFNEGELIGESTLINSTGEVFLFAQKGDQSFVEKLRAKDLLHEIIAKTNGTKIWEVNSKYPESWFSVGGRIEGDKMIYEQILIKN